MNSHHCVYSATGQDGHIHIEPTTQAQGASIEKNSSSLFESLTREQLASLLEIGLAFASERKMNSLLEKILFKAMEITRADGGTIYLVNREINKPFSQRLDFYILRNKSLDIHVGGTAKDKIELPPLKLFDESGSPLMSNVASAVYHRGNLINVDDVYHNTDLTLDFSGTSLFDKRMGYRSKSFLATPLFDQNDGVLGVLQLINARNDAGEAISFAKDMEALVLAFSGQAGTMVNAQLSTEKNRALWENMVKMLGSSIDQKSRYTSLHCQRVPILANMIAESVNKDKVSTYKDVHFSESDLYEINMAALLHDIGKIITPEYVMDKSTKLETIFDRIHLIRQRFEILLRDAEIRLLKERLSGKINEDQAATEYANEYQRLTQQWEFVSRCNIGGEFMRDDDIARLETIAEQEWTCHFDRSMGVSAAEQARIVSGSPKAQSLPYVCHLIENLPEHKFFISDRETIDRGEINNLKIRRGTLSSDERHKIEEHVSTTIHMLRELSLSEDIPNVVEYAGSHHEKIDGTGYPNRRVGGEMSLPARILCVADIFEAVSASDRPYKNPKTLSECVKIMYLMARDNHIDRSLFQLFLRSQIYLEYAQKHMKPNMCDEVDVEYYLSQNIFDDAPPVPQNSKKNPSITYDDNGLPLFFTQNKSIAVLNMSGQL